MDVLFVIPFLALSVWIIVVLVRWFFFSSSERMTLSLRKIAIVFVLLLQFFLMAVTLFDPLHGPFDSRYRHSERVRAYLDWKQSPAESSKAAYSDEMGRLHSYLRTRDATVLLVLGVEAVAVYYLWNRKARQVA